MSETRPYVIDVSGYVHGPYMTLFGARSAARSGDEVVMLSPDDINPDTGTLYA